MVASTLQVEKKVFSSMEISGNKKSGNRKVCYCCSMMRVTIPTAIVLPVARSVTLPRGL